MGWSKSRAQERIKTRKKQGDSYKVVPHKKEMDFSSLGTKEIRKVDGIHKYYDIPNFPSLVEEAGEDLTKQKKLLQAAHVFRRGLEDLTEVFESQMIQDQNLRSHYLKAKPYDDTTRMAQNAVLEAISLNSYVYDAFNTLFDEPFRARVGMSYGTTFIGNIGVNGERELISLGSAANYGAKILGASGSVVACSKLYVLLPKRLQALFEQIDDDGLDRYVLKQARWSLLKDVKTEFKINFDESKIIRGLKDYKSALPLSDIDVTLAKTPIDFDGLSESKAKRSSTVSFVADVDGFTKLIENAEEDEKVVNLFSLMRDIRCECHEVVRNDFDGMIIQHRGDATYGLLNLPIGESGKVDRSNKGIEIALSLQASMALVMKEYPDYSLSLSVGAADSMNLYARIGRRGTKHLLVIGKSNEESEVLQQNTSGGDTSISNKIYDQLETDLQVLFKKISVTKYTAAGKTIEDTYDLESEKDKATKNLKIEVAGPQILVKSTIRDEQPFANQGNWSN